jgi:hypothetical protein
MKQWTFVVLLFSLVSSSASLAATAGRTAVLDEVQLNSHSRTDNPDIVWIKQTGPWTGTSCLADWGYFNAKENAQFVATILSARVTESPVRIFVDDSYAKIGGVCLITLVTL